MRSRRAKHFPPFRARLAGILLLSCVCIVWGRFESVDCDGAGGGGEEDTDSGSGSGSGSSSGEGDQDGWANGTELCRGVIGTNSSHLPARNISGVCYHTSRNRCNKQHFVSLTTDKVSYVNASSTIVASIEPNSTRYHETLYYILCYNMNAGTEESDIVAECANNGTTIFSEYKWPEEGEAELTVYVHTGSSFSDSDFLDCGTAEVTVASDFGLNLTVKLLNEPSQLEEGTHPYYEAGKEPNDLLVVGNVTFAATATLLSGLMDRVKFYFYYVVSGPLWKDAGVCSHHSNWTQEFLNVGEYSYSVHAIAKIDSSEAHHANFSGVFELLEGLSDPLIQVGNNNSVKVGTKEQLTITAEGSTPITACWFQTKLLEQTGSIPSLKAEDTPLSLLSRNNESDIPVEDCVVLNNSNTTVFDKDRTFDEVGTFQFVAHFYNGASQMKKNFTFSVYAGKSTVVVASSATAVAVGVVLIVLIVVIVVLVAGGYIPYKKYKNRMTETADFKFVDLSETGSSWERFKRKAHELRDRLRTKRHSEKIGLVNLGDLPTSEQRRRSFYGANTLTEFAPYETI